MSSLGPNPPITIVRDDDLEPELTPPDEAIDKLAEMLYYDIHGAFIVVGWEPTWEHALPATRKRFVDAAQKYASIIRTCDSGGTVHIEITYPTI